MRKRAEEDRISTWHDFLEKYDSELQGKKNFQSDESIEQTDKKYQHEEVRWTPSVDVSKLMSKSQEDEVLEIPENLKFEIDQRDKEIQRLRKEVGRLSKKASSDLQPILKEAVRLGSEGEFEKVIEQVNKILIEYSDHPTALEMKAAALYNLHRYAEAKILFDRLLNMAPNNIDALSTVGQMLMDSDPRQAISYLDRALKINPKDVFSLVVKGNALANLKEYEEAAFCFDRAYSVEPSDLGILHMKAGAIMKTGNLPEAAKIYDKILSFNPNDAAALASMGYIIAASGEPKKGMDFVKAALSIDPNEETALHYKGAIERLWSSEI